MDNRILPSEFPILSTSQFILRELVEDDALRMYSVLSSEKVTQYFGMFPLIDVETAKGIIIRYKNSFNEDFAIRWGIELKESNIIIGTCGFHNWNHRHKRAEIGYELHEDYWGKGYAKEAIKTIIEYGFSNMQLSRIEAMVYPENKNSEKLLRKIGFDYEGLLKGYAFFRNKQQDLKMFSLLNNDLLK
ncbi:GNAT family N-acetyltransferase [Lacrimispora sp.]|uniref:GNAT family N-acetyltransferase n=1 Tax=Lacrimispora sp. TaxID=2719234 RepID=UPI0028AD4585|nr:GNAT family N-acetyltransferase [Lacrimispora sp.]